MSRSEESELRWVCLKILTSVLVYLNGINWSVIRMAEPVLTYTQSKVISVWLKLVFRSLAACPVYKIGSRRPTLWWMSQPSSDNHLIASVGMHVIQSSEAKRTHIIHHNLISCLSDLHKYWSHNILSTFHKYYLQVIFYHISYRFLML
jgi:hypothetical protein